MASKGTKRRSRSRGSAPRGAAGGDGGLRLRSRRRKWLTLIRHGQSTAQVAGKQERMSLKQVDARLTGKGQKQANDLGPKLDKPELVCVSTLSRAIQTACILFKPRGGRSAPPAIIATPLLCELGSSAPENKTRDIESLRKDRGVAGLPCFGNITFDAGSAATTNAGVSAERACARFCRWLDGRSERHITIVGHSLFLGNLVGRKVRFMNCCPIEAVIDGKGVALTTAEERRKALAADGSVETGGRSNSSRGAAARAAPSRSTPLSGAAARSRSGSRRCKKR